MNIANIYNCYGCGVCATICGQKIINIELNSKGFYEPRIIDISKCTDCGLCVNVCAYSHNDLSVNNRPLASYASWSKESSVRHKCSSGGVGFEIGRTLIEQGYKVCGVRYNVDNGRAEHYIATTAEELLSSIGSKYIQSYTIDGFKSINKNEKYLVIGTPCQIDSFRRYIQKFKKENNFILMDFFCHSVPSMLAWKKYLQLAEKTTGKINYVSWRNKCIINNNSSNNKVNSEDSSEFLGWHKSYNLLIKGEKRSLYSPLSKGDIFYNLFLGDFCCNKACQKDCKYKYDKSSADIRIGDFWGSKYSNNKDGVSAFIAFTTRGLELSKQLNCELIEHPFELVTEGQMKSNVHHAILSRLAWKMLLSKKEYSILQWKFLIYSEKILQLPKRIINKIKMK